MKIVTVPELEMFPDAAELADQLQDDREVVIAYASRSLRLSLDRPGAD